MFFISKKKTSKLYCWPYLKSTQQTKIDNSSIVQRLFEPDGSPQCGSRVSNSERLLFARQLWLYIFRWLMTKGLIYALLTLGRAAFASTRRRISNSSFPFLSFQSSRFSLAMASASDHSLAAWSSPRGQNKPATPHDRGGFGEGRSVGRNWKLSIVVVSI